MSGRRDLLVTSALVLAASFIPNLLGLRPANAATIPNFPAPNPTSPTASIRSDTSTPARQTFLLSRCISATSIPISCLGKV